MIDVCMHIYKTRRNNHSLCIYYFRSIRLKFSNFYDFPVFHCNISRKGFISQTVIYCTTSNYQVIIRRTGKKENTKTNKKNFDFQCIHNIKHFILQRSFGKYKGCSLTLYMYIYYNTDIGEVL
ncbi:hypothetical protein ES708_25201 [subsurface metagenome]